MHYTKNLAPNCELFVVVRKELTDLLLDDMRRHQEKMMKVLMENRNRNELAI